MAEEFGGLISDDEWWESDYMDAEDYRSVHGASNVGDFSWSGQDMWNTAPDFSGQTQSNYMHGLLGGGFNAYSTPNAQEDTKTYAQQQLDKVKGNFFDGEKAFILGQQKNILNDVPTLDHRFRDVTTSLQQFENDVRSPKDLGMFPALHRRPSLSDKAVDFSKGLIGGIGTAVKRTVGGPAMNWYNNMDRVSQSTIPFDKTQPVVNQMNPNFGSSVAKEFKGLVDIAINPIETGKAAINLASGALQHLVPDTLAWNQVDKDMASAVGQAINTKYGSVGGWQKALSEDPFEAIALLTGVGFLGKGVIGGIGKVIDPTTVDKVAGKFGITPMPKLNIAPVGKPWTMKSKGEGDFYIKRVGDNAGKVSKTREGPSDIAFSVDQDVLLPDYAYYAVMSLQESFKARAHGSVQQAINQHDVDDILTKFFQEQNGQGSPSAVPTVVNTDYRLSHTASSAEKGSSLDDFSDIFPEAPTDPNFQRYYGFGGEYAKADLETIDVMKRVSGRPDAMVTIYRAVPIGVKEINAGDWVSTSKSYATEHGQRYIDEGYDLITKEVRASELNTDGDLHEWGYNPITKPLYTGEQALITQHNTSAENIMKMRDHGGKMPGPSVAAVSIDNLMTPDQFGGVSLFSDSDLANAESLVSSTWTGDAYTIRAPDEYLHYVNEDAVKAQFTPEQLEFFSIGEYDSMPSPGKLEGDMLFVDLLEEIGGMDRTNYNNFSEMQSAASDPTVLGWTEAVDIRAMTHDEPFFGEVNRTMRTKGLSAKDSSHTYPLYSPEAATLDMLSKGAHKSGTEFGEEVNLPLEESLGLALAQRKYETLDQIKDDRSRVMGSNRTQRDAWGDMFYDVEGKVEDILDTKDGEFISAVLSSALSGEPLNAPHSGFTVDMLANPVTDYQWEQIMTLVNPMKEFALKMDVNYLEAKPRRIVNANEFKGAAIPTGKPQVRKALEEMGITKIFEYSNKQEHKDIAKKFPELFYNQQPTGLMDELQ